MTHEEDLCLNIFSAGHVVIVCAAALFNENSPTLCFKYYKPFRFQLVKLPCVMAGPGAGEELKINSSATFQDDT